MGKTNKRKLSEWRPLLLPFEDALDLLQWEDPAHSILENIFGMVICINFSTVYIHPADLTSWTNWKSFSPCLQNKVISLRIEKHGLTVDAAF